MLKSIQKVLAVAEKELSIYLTTLVGYTGFGAFAFLMGLVFITSLNNYQDLTQQFLAQKQGAAIDRLNFNDGIIIPMLSSGLGLFLFFIPFLTMRLFAEEKSGRTFELLMTTPLRTVEIVFGKYLAVTTMVLVYALIPLVFPVILHVYGSSSDVGSPVEWWPVASGFGSIFVMGVTCASVGLLVSSLSETQVVASVGTFAILLVAFVLPTLAQRVEGDWRLVLEYLTPVSHVGRAIQGRVHLSDVIYFASINVGCLYFTHRVVEGQRWR